MIRTALALAILAPALLVQAQEPPPRADTAQLRQFRGEAEAFNRQDPFANAYRAGRYNGYWQGVLDVLQGRTVCFRACPCEIDKLIGNYLSDHPEASEQAAVDWLVPLLEASYPCK